MIAGAAERCIATFSAADSQMRRIGPKGAIKAGVAAVMLLAIAAAVSAAVLEGEVEDDDDFSTGEEGDDFSTGGNFEQATRRGGRMAHAAVRAYAHPVEKSLRMGAKEGDHHHLMYPALEGDHDDWNEKQTVGQSLLGGGEETAEFDGSTVARMVVKSGRMSIVGRPDRNVTKIALDAEAAVKKFNGHVTNRNQHPDGNFADYAWRINDKGVRVRERRANKRPVITLEMKVPVAQYEPALAAIQALVREDEVQEVSVNSRDVTDRFVDAAARAASLEATHRQLLRLMKRADSVKDVLAVQHQLSQTEQDLESKKATMASLQKTSSMSSLTLTIRKHPPLEQEWAKAKVWSPGETVARAQTGVVKLFQNAVDSIIFAVIYVAPLSIISCIIWCLVHAAMKLATDTSGHKSSVP